MLVQDEATYSLKCFDLVCRVYCEKFKGATNYCDPARKTPGLSANYSWSFKCSESFLANTNLFFSLPLCPVATDYREFEFRWRSRLNAPAMGLLLTTKILGDYGMSGYCLDEGAGFKGVCII